MSPFRLGLGRVIYDPGKGSCAAVSNVPREATVAQCPSCPRQGGPGEGSQHFGAGEWKSVLLKFLLHVPMSACILKTKIKKKKPLDFTLDKPNRCNKADKYPMSQDLYFYLFNAYTQIFLTFCS